MAMQKPTNMKFRWSGQDGQTKLRILRACVFPIATYGCDTRTLGKAILKKVTVKSVEPRPGQTKFLTSF